MARLRRKHVLLGLGGIAVGLAVLVVFLPTLLNLGPGHGLITSAIDRQVRGTSSIEAMRLSWFRAQRIDGLAVRDETGRKAVDVDVEVAGGLLGLLASGFSDLDVKLSGEVEGELRDDGTTSFQELLRPSDDAGGPAPPGDGGDVPAGLPSITVTLDGIAVTLAMVEIADPEAPETDEVGVTETLVFGGINGTLRLAPGEDLELTLDTPVTAGPRAGSLAVRASARDLVDAAGRVSLGRAALDVVITGTDLPAPFAPEVEIVPHLELRASSPGLERSLDLSVQGEAVLSGAEPSTLEGAVTITGPVDAAGRVRIGLDTIAGALTGRRVPTALLQPVLAGNHVLLTRDVGPLVDVTARFEPSAGGEHDDAAAPGSRVSIGVEAARLRVDLTATVDAEGAVEGDRLTARATLDPALLAAVAGVAASAPLTLDVDLSSWSMLPRGDGPGSPLDTLAVTGLVTATGAFSIGGAGMPAFETLRMNVASEAIGRGGHLDGSVRWGDADLRFDADCTLPERGPDEAIALERISGRLALTSAGTARLPIGGDGAAWTLDELTANVETPALGERIAVRGWAGVGGGRVGVDLAATGAFDRDGRLALADLVPIGRVTIEGLPAERMLELLPANAAPARPLLVGTLAATLSLTELEGGLLARLGATTDRVDVATEIRRAGGTIELRGTNAMVDVTPELVAELQAGAEDPVTLAAPTTLRIGVDPVTFTETAPWRVDAGKVSPSGRIALDDATISQASLAVPVRVRGFSTKFGARLGDAPQYTATGGARLALADRDEPLGAASWDLTVSGGEPLATNGTVGLEEFGSIAMGRLLGFEGAPLDDWAGDGGRVAIELEGGAAERAQGVRVRVDMKRLQANVMASVRDDTAVVTATDPVRLTLTASHLDRLLGIGRKGAGKAAVPVRVNQDVPVEVRLGAFSLPLAAARGEAFDPAAAEIDVDITAGGALTFGDGEGSLMAIDAFALAVRSADLSEGLQVELTGKTSGRGVEPGVLDLRGRVAGLVGADSTLAAEDARLTVEATLEHVPTALADGVLGLDGLLTAIAGTRMSATIQADDFSHSSGWLDGRLTAEQGFLAGRVEGRDRALHTSGDRAVEAELELSPALRNRLLKDVHPIFADIRSAEKPIQFALQPGAVIPLDGNRRRLHADARIEVGRIEIDRGTSVLAAMTFFAQAPESTRPGLIEPIVIRVREGILTYDRFAMEIDAVTMVWEGKVDLVARTLETRTEIPVKSVVDRYTEVEHIEGVKGVLAVRGPIDAYETSFEVPLEDAARGALDSFIKKGLGELFKKKDPE